MYDVLTANTNISLLYNVPGNQATVILQISFSSYRWRIILPTVTPTTVKLPLNVCSRKNSGLKITPIISAFIPVSFSRTPGIMAWRVNAAMIAMTNDEIIDDSGPSVKKKSTTPITRQVPKERRSQIIAGNRDAIV